MNLPKFYLPNLSIVFLIFLLALKTNAQPYLPGYTISSEGKVQIQVPDGNTYFLFQNWSSDEIELTNLTDGIPHDSMLIVMPEYDQILGQVTNEPFNAFLPGFGKSNALFSPAIITSFIWYDPEYKPSARWDTNYYSTSNYSCNGNMSISNHCNAIHYNSKNIPDSMINLQMLYIDNAQVFIPRAGFSMKSNNNGLAEHIRIFGYLSDDDKYIPYFESRIDFDYDRKGRLIRVISSNVPESPKTDTKWMLGEMRRIQSNEYQKPAFDSLNLKLKSENRREGITGWLEFIYDNERFIEGWGFSDMYSEIHRVKAEYTNDLLTSFTAYNNTVTYTRSNFNYDNTHKLQSILVESQYGESQNLTRYNPLNAQFVYTQKGELCGFQQKQEEQ